MKLYTLSPRELRVLLDVYERHIDTLSDRELEAMSWDPLDIVIDLKTAHIRSVLVAVDLGPEPPERS